MQLFGKRAHNVRPYMSEADQNRFRHRKTGRLYRRSSEIYRQSVSAEAGDCWRPKAPAQNKQSPRS